MGAAQSAEDTKQDAGAGAEAKAVDGVDVQKKDSGEAAVGDGAAGAMVLEKAEALMEPEKQMTEALKQSDLKKQVKTVVRTEQIVFECESPSYIKQLATRLAAYMDTCKAGDSGREAGKLFTGAIDKMIKNPTGKKQAQKSKKSANKSGKRSWFPCGQSNVKHVKKDVLEKSGAKEALDKLDLSKPALPAAAAGGWCPPCAPSNRSGELEKKTSGSKKSSKAKSGEGSKASSKKPSKIPGSDAAKAGRKPKGTKKVEEVKQVEEEIVEEVKQVDEEIVEEQVEEVEGLKKIEGSESFERDEKDEKVEEDWIYKSDPMHGYPQLGHPVVRALRKSSVHKLFQIDEGNATQYLFFEQFGVTTKPHGHRVLSVQSCRKKLGHSFVYSFDSTVFRLAIPQNYRERSFATLVFSRSASMLVIGALAPSVAVCIYVAATSRITTDKLFDRILDKFDVFINAFTFCVMRFHSHLGELNFPSRIAFAFAAYYSVIFLNVLQGEVVSSSQGSRIPESRCSYDYCANVDVKSLLRSRKDRGKDLAYSFVASESGTIGPQPPLRKCRRRKKELQEAHHSIAFGNETLLALLYLGRGICGRSDLMRIQANSIKSRGLLLEEGLSLEERSTQLCADFYVPWILRRALENSLFAFSFFDMQGGFNQKHDQREIEYWSRDDAQIRRVRLFLKENQQYLRKLYAKLRMSGSDGTTSLTLMSLKAFLFVTLILILISVVVLVLEKWRNLFLRLGSSSKLRTQSKWKCLIEEVFTDSDIKDGSVKPGAILANETWLMNEECPPQIPQCEWFGSNREEETGKHVKAGLGFLIPGDLGRVIALRTEIRGSEWISESVYVAHERGRQNGQLFEAMTEYLHQACSGETHVVIWCDMNAHINQFAEVENSRAYRKLRGMEIDEERLRTQISDHSLITAEFMIEMRNVLNISKAEGKPRAMVDRTGASIETKETLRKEMLGDRSAMYGTLGEQY
ncbi:uncharacterized protein LOC100906237 [Galendromus occidentalis]|uniref:Uncharacterized protein LOC100906237 n=1 Tax=Galendromus occidentalis TaxID=34638 RepID=A0AAJ6QZ14_9ACAR|nr:uncharacterized protein LOC100906237 [Galendromus occidentalis]